MIGRKAAVKDLHWTLHPFVLNIELGFVIFLILLLFIISIINGTNGIIILLGILTGFISIYPLIKWEEEAILRNWDKIDKTRGFVIRKAVWDDPVTKKVLKVFYFVYLPIFYVSFFLFVYLYGLGAQIMVAFGFVIFSWALLGVLPIYTNVKKYVNGAINT
jgi:hypothetical protein